MLVLFQRVALALAGTAALVDPGLGAPSTRGSGHNLLVGWSPKHSAILPPPNRLDLSRKLELPPNYEFSLDRSLKLLLGLKLPPGFEPKDIPYPTTIETPKDAVWKYSAPPELDSMDLESFSKLLEREVKGKSSGNGHKELFPPWVFGSYARELHDFYVAEAKGIEAKPQGTKAYSGHDSPRQELLKSIYELGTRFLKMQGYDISEDGAIIVSPDNNLARDTPLISNSQVAHHGAVQLSETGRHGLVSEAPSSPVTNSHNVLEDFWNKKADLEPVPRFPMWTLQHDYNRMEIIGTFAIRDFKNLIAQKRNEEFVHFPRWIFGRFAQALYKHTNDRLRQLTMESDKFVDELKLRTENRDWKSSNDASNLWKERDKWLLPKLLEIVETVDSYAKLFLQRRGLYVQEHGSILPIGNTAAQDEESLKDLLSATLSMWYSPTKTKSIISSLKKFPLPPEGAEWNPAKKLGSIQFAGLGHFISELETEVEEGTENAAGKKLGKKKNRPVHSGENDLVYFPKWIFGKEEVMGEDGIQNVFVEKAQEYWYDEPVAHLSISKRAKDLVNNLEYIGILFLRARGFDVLGDGSVVAKTK